MVSPAAVVKEVQAELQKASREKVRLSTLRFFKEKINPIGVNNPTMRGVAKKVVRHYNDENKKLGTTTPDFWFDVTEKLLKTGVFEEGFTGLFLLEYSNAFAQKNAIDHFESYLQKYIHNWAWDDELCDSISFHFILFPTHVAKTKEWVKSSNRWVARASVVSLIRFNKKMGVSPLLLDHVRYLKRSNDDLLHKACGWALREAWKKDPALIEEFLLTEKGLPRTTVRYAIERLPEKKRKEFLAQTRS